jgi:hypothetical protein
MADPFCGHVEGRPGCASYRLFLGRDYSMVVRDGHRRALRFRLQSRDLSCEGRSEIGRRAIRDSEWDYHGGTDRPLHTHLGSQEDLTGDAANPLAGRDERI